MEQLAVKPKATLEEVTKLANEMLKNGVEPTTRNLSVHLQGRTSSIQGFLIEYKNNLEHRKNAIAEEVGSLAVAKLLSQELLLMIDRRNESLTEQVAQLTRNLDETLSLLSDSEDKLESVLNTTAAQVAEIETSTASKVEKAQSAVSLIEQQLRELKATSEKAIDDARNHAKAEVLKAEALVDAANGRVAQAETELRASREQIKLLSIDVAKRELEQRELEQAKVTIATLQATLSKQQDQISYTTANLERLTQDRTELKATEAKLGKTAENLTATLVSVRGELAESRAKLAEVNAEKLAFERDTQRLNTDLNSYRQQANQLGSLQAELISVEKQLNQVKLDLSQSEREREILSQALAANRVAGSQTEKK
jgi:predicted phage tail protein